MPGSATPTLPLRESTLHALRPRLDVPAYDRRALGRGVVHISVGYFHRSHQAVYFDDLARSGASAEWGVVGIAHRSPAMHRALAAQDNLYTLVERSAAGDSARVVGALVDYLYAPDDRERVIEAMAAASTRLVTLTITGAGYHVNPMTGEFDARHPEIAADLRRPGRPRSALGTIVEALDRRRRRGSAPFTVLSCDNLAANGAVARTALVSFAEARDPALSRWIARGVAFPSSMVDRITPRTTADDRDLVERRFGVRDTWPVMTEPFSQWVVEDEFCDGRPPLDEVGVQFVSDVRPYALIKTRLLNATHCALGHLGSVAGHRHTDAAMRDPVLARYVAGLMRDDMQPGLPVVAGDDPAAYRRTLLERLANPGIPDQLSRLARSGSTKVPRHLLSAVADARAAGRPHPSLTLAVAGWCRYLRGVDETGRRYVVDDPDGDRLGAIAAAAGTDPRPLLAERAIFGELGSDTGFAAELEQALVAMERSGVRGALASLGTGRQRVAA